METQLLLDRRWWKSEKVRKYLYRQELSVLTGLYHYFRVKVLCTNCGAHSDQQGAFESDINKPTEEILIHTTSTFTLKSVTIENVFK